MQIYLSVFYYLDFLLIKSKAQKKELTWRSTPFTEIENHESPIL
jgi:hypothetical protein